MTVVPGGGAILAILSVATPPRGTTVEGIVDYVVA
jgi:hypothetical protein